jgi:DNA helicase II / ATP-dependent DNA helicase PcrA
MGRAATDLAEIKEPLKTGDEDIMEWSDRQQAVFEEVAAGDGHAMINAVAGSGKTTTILEAMRYVPTGLKVLFVAFNKPIAMELEKRAPEGVAVSTLHSLGLKACTRSLDRPRVDASKAKDIARAVTGVELNPTRREWCVSVVKCVSLAKSYLADTPEKIEDVMDLHQLCPPETEKERPAFVKDVMTVLDACKTIMASVDFDDMVWLPIVLGLKVPSYDRIFVDETQDLNASQIALVLKALKPGGRICAVGDPRQAIYGFRGAAADAFEKVRSALDAKVLPLSVTYRCARTIVREAQALVPHLEAAPNAEEGAVMRVAEERMLKEAVAGDFVLSRINAPLLKLCLAFLREGRRANIQGRDVGTKLSSLVKRSKTWDVDGMLRYVDRWSALEIARLAQRELDGTGVEDMRECVHALSEGETSVADVLGKIDRLFADGDETSRITLSSTHKAKGMERDRVWLLESTYMRKRKGQETISTEEANLKYVAITRARKDLFLVQSNAEV